MSVSTDKLYFSWRDLTHYSHSPSDFLALIRNQKLIDSVSCAHHAAGGALEMCYRLALCKEDRLKENGDVRVDIQSIVDGCGAPSKLRKVMDFLKKDGASITRGGLKVEDKLKLRDYRILKPNHVKEDLSRMLEHVLLRGPVAGSFILRKDFKPYDEEIYNCTGEIRMTKYMRPVKHAVLVTGLGFDKNFVPFWEYQESDLPYHYSYRRDGYHRIAFTGFEAVFIPYI